MIRASAELSVEDKAERNLFRKVFSTPEGKRVLTAILADLGTFDRIPMEEGSIALRNYGIRLLELSGLLDEVKIPAWVELMLSLVADENKEN